MPYRDYYRADCKHCGRLREEGERFSARGRCEACGDGHAVANRRELAERSGPFYDHWRRRSYMAARRLLLDDVPPRE